MRGTKHSPPPDISDISVAWRGNGLSVALGKVLNASVVGAVATGVALAVAILVLLFAGAFMVGHEMGNSAQAQSDTLTTRLDTSFGVGGKLTTSFYPSSGCDTQESADEDTAGACSPVASEIHAIAQQSDGKIVAAGFAQVKSNSKKVFALARYNTSGGLDTSFGEGGLLVTDVGGVESEARGVAVQPDGKIVVAGAAHVGDTDTGAYEFAVVRYNTDGSLDTGFGEVVSENTRSGMLTTRLSPTQTDGAQTVTQDIAHAIAVDADGKIVVAGKAGKSFGLARYTTVGELDTTFSADGKVFTSFSGQTGEQGDSYAVAVAISSDGKIVAVGNSDYKIIAKPNLNVVAVARYNSNGSLDKSFSSDGRATMLSAYYTAIEVYAGGATFDGSGNLLITGYSNFSGFVARFNKKGGLDRTFVDPLVASQRSSTHVKGIVFNNVAFGIEGGNAVAVLSDGRIVTAGFGNNKFLASWYNLSFSVEKDIFVGFSGDAAARALVVQTDGNLVLAGYANNGSVNEFALARVLGEEAAALQEDPEQEEQEDTDGSEDSGDGSGNQEIVTIITTTTRVSETQQVVATTTVPTTTTTTVPTETTTTTTVPTPTTTPTTTTLKPPPPRPRQSKPQVSGVRTPPTAATTVPTTTAPAASSTTTTIKSTTTTVRSAGLTDIGDGGVHSVSLSYLYDEGVFDGTGCGEGKLCPYGAITRWEMAVWLGRVLENQGEVEFEQASEAGDTDFGFVDIGDLTWQARYINTLAQLQVTVGCSTEPLRFCPNDFVTRAQMASFLVRTPIFPDVTVTDAGFEDVDEDNVHRSSINKIFAAGITQGCSTDPWNFCPDEPTTRAQMASFLYQLVQ